MIALNIYGGSEISIAGNGAVIITNPDPPINLIENSELRNKTTLGIQWSPSSQTGGTSIIDYRVSISSFD